MKFLSSLSALAIASLSAFAFAADWPQFLGPDGDGHSRDNVPTQWSERDELAWKVDLPGSGSSSPIVTGDRVILTCYVDGTSPKRQLLCFNKSNGKRLWEVDFPIDYEEDPYRGFISEHGYASNTPATDGNAVYLFLGKGGAHAVSLEGQKLWSVDVGKRSSNRQWGSGSSVLLYKDNVIINAADESRAIYCLDKATGKEVWKQETEMLELTYGTPRIVSGANGVDELVISVPEEIWSLNPQTGKLKWYATSPMTGNVSPSVIVDGDIVYSFGGYRASGSIALNVGGKGDVSDSKVVWTNRSSSYVATPVLHDGRFYWVDDRGIAYCTSAENGDVVYRERVGKLSGGRPVYASPVVIGDYIYVVTRRSGTLVLKAGDNYQEVARNEFSGDETDFNASPAVSDGRLYLRSNQSLYCVGGA